MPIDPNIALRVQRPNIVGPVEMAQFQDMLNRNKLSQLEMQEVEGRIKGKNALTSLYANPQNFDPSGAPTEGALRTFGASGGDAMTLRNQLIQRQQTQSAIERNVATTRREQEVAAREESENFARSILPVGRATLAKYNDALKRGVPIDEATRQAQDFYLDQVGELEKSGQVPKKFTDAARQAKFNPYTFQARVTQFASALGDKSAQPQSGIAKLKADFEAGRITKAEYDAGARKATHVSGGEGAGGDAGGGLPKGVKEYILPNTNKHYGSGNGMAYELVDGKWKKIPNDQLPQKLVKVGSVAAGQGAREAVFTQRKVGAAEQASADLTNIVLLPITTDRGAYQFGSVSVPSFLDATKVVIGNKMTPESGQIYNRMSAGLQRSLATVEAQGLMPSGSLTHQMDSVLWKPGDTVQSKLHALAQIRQIIDAQMKVELHNPRVSDDEKELIKEIIDDVHKAVPFTHKDLIDLYKTQEKNPNATLRSVIGKTKSSAGAAGRPTDGDQGGKQNYSRYWSKPATASKRGSPAPANTKQGEDADDDSDTDNE